MNSNKSFNPAEWAVIVCIVLVLAAILFPVFIKARTAQENRCQSNMYQIGRAIHLYLSDWDYVYPTNRQYIPNANPPVISDVALASAVRLSNPGLLDQQGEPIRFQYGYGWVEGLYPYIERISVGSKVGVWKCPAARATDAFSQGTWASVTYSFNRNLIEKSRSVVRTSSKTMMCREMDRRYSQILRPSNDCAAVGSVPVDPFLDNFPPDSTTFRSLNWRLHGEGSHILFADGHVKGYPAAYFHSTGQWDTATQRWWNWVNIHPSTDVRRVSIAISP